MSRLLRRYRTNKECGIKSSGGLTDAFDNMIKSVWRISDQEYDQILEKMTDEEMDLFLTEKPSFSEKKRLLILVESILDKSVTRDENINEILNNGEN